MEGTPGLTPDDLHLPALPPVDEEVGSHVPNVRKARFTRGCVIQRGGCGAAVAAAGAPTHRRPG